MFKEFEIVWVFDWNFRDRQFSKKIQIHQKKKGKRKNIFLSFLLHIHSVEINCSHFFLMNHFLLTFRWAKERESNFIFRWLLLEKWIKLWYFVEFFFTSFLPISFLHLYDTNLHSINFYGHFSEKLFGTKKIFFSLFIYLFIFFVEEDFGRSLTHNNM